MEHRLRRAVLTALAVPVCLLVRLLRPVVVIRFGRLYSSRIGHLAANTELYRCLRLSRGRGKPPTWDLFYPTVVVANNQLQRMWNRILTVHPFVQYLEKVSRALPGWQRHVVELPTDRDLWGLYATVPPALSFTSEEEQLGREGLRKMGLSEGDRFVCFAARDPAYLAGVNPGADLKNHDYRDTEIDNYLPAMEEMTVQGCFALRLGAAVAKDLQTTNPRIIDYASRYRDEFMDVYLCANCHFFLGDTAGLYSLATIFRRPVAWSNLIPLEYAPTWGKDDLFIPKLLWIRGEKRFMTFREIAESRAGRFSLTEQYEAKGLEPVQNTPEEIAALAREMDDRIRGVWQTTEEDEDLQRRFWALFPASELNQVFLCRIGAEFLRRHKELLA